MNQLDETNGVPVPDAGRNPVLASAVRGLASPQLGALLTLAATLTFGIGLIAWAMKPDYVPVSNQGSRDEALQIVEILQRSSVPYKLDAGTGLVLVPSERSAEVRMSLAANGFGESRAIGLELLQQDASLGTSHFTETARYQHALETELSRTISAMRNVESARVHLALPKQSVFIRDREQASASVMIKVHTGRTLEDEQINSVINLVASSIPYLESGQVTLVDQWGRLLSTGDDSTDGATRGQYQYARRLEKLFSERIESLLSPVIGNGRVRAIVTAEIDFSINERTEESFEPDQAQLRSEEKQSQTSQGGAAIGVPGALTNQPPDNGTTDPAIDPADPAASVPRNQSSTEVRNYELDKTVSHVRQAPGNIRRLSAAVIIDDRMALDDAGLAVRTPLSEDELAEYTSLAQEAIGFDATRGDSVVVFNRSFQPAEEILPLKPLPLWQQNWLWTMVKQVLIGLSVLLLVMLVLRPAARRLLPDRSRVDSVPDAGEPGAIGAGNDKSTTSGAASLAPPAAVYGDILNMARAMSADDPKRVAKVVKDWVSE